MYIPGFGERLQKLRKGRHLTQTQLGDLLGLNKAIISKYENDLSYPPYDVLINFAKTFKVSADYLLGLEKDRGVSVVGLTDSQIEALNRVAEEFRKAGRGENQYVEGT